MTDSSPHLADQRETVKTTDIAERTLDYKIPQIIGASAVGTMIEWYDFYIFGSLATVISPLFYPSGNDTLALIAYLSTFAVGFVVRPFGALFFGRIGYHIGNGVFGGLLPLIGLAVVAKTGNIYAGLYYPIVIAGITFIVGSLLLKETHSVPIWKEIETARPGELQSDIDGPA